MFKDLRKKLSTPENLTIIFYGATLFVILARLIDVIIKINYAKPITPWASWEYTIAFLLPLGGFAYFCSSKFSKNTNHKIKFYYVTYIGLMGIAAVMLAQWANQLTWFLLGFLDAETLQRAYIEIPDRLKTAIQAVTIYLPVICIPPTLPMVSILFDTPDPIGALKNVSLINTNKKPAMSTGALTCEVKVCKDANSGESIVIPENRRMESTLIQGATGTGKTTTLMLPMCASDLEKKFFFRELSKELCFKALEDGLAYLAVPYSEEQINKYFSPYFVRPIKGKEKQFKEALKDIIKYENEETGELVYRDLGITVLEPDGQYVSDFKQVAANFGIEVLTIDPSDPNSYGINPFINKEPAKVASIISTVLKGMSESENPSSNNAFFAQVTQQALENLAILLKIIYPQMNNGQVPTLEDMLALLYDYDKVEEMCEEVKKDPVLSVKYKILIKYFEKNFYKPPLDINGRPVIGTVGSNRKETEQFLYGATTQLDNLMRNKDVRRILCSRDNNINLDHVLAHGQCVAVCSRRGKLGALLSKPFGMFYILTMQDAVLRRPGEENTRIPHFMYIDEFPDFVNKETETCFTLFRKYRCAMIIAIQNLSQLERVKSMKFYKQVVLSNCKTVLIFGDTNKEDSEYWSKAFGRTEYFDIGNSLKTRPVNDAQKPGDTGWGSETYSMGVDYYDNMKTFNINKQGFKRLIYKTRDANGKNKQGWGKTEFLDKKYKEIHESKDYKFGKHINSYANYSDSYTIPSQQNTVKESDWSIIDEENTINQILASYSTLSATPQNVLTKAEAPISSNPLYEIDIDKEIIDTSNIINEPKIEYISDDDIQIEIPDDIN